MARIYPTIAETINKSLFEVMVPDTLELNIPTYYRKYPEFAPFYESTGTYSKANLPIKDIVYICYQGHQFEVVHQNDSILIVDLINQYLDEYREVVSNLPSDHPSSLLYKMCSHTNRVMGTQAQINRDNNEQKGLFRKPKSIADIIGKLTGF